jgi:hypothetical protein
MKTTLGILLSAAGNPKEPGPLAKLAKSELPLKLSYRLSKFLKSVQEELAVFEEKRIELVYKYAEKDVEGNIPDKKNVRVAEGKIAEFTKEYSDLTELEVELDYKPFKLSELQSVNFTPAEIGTLLSFIENDL